MVFMKICWGVTILVTTFAAFGLFFGVVAANGAPQEAAVGAIVAATCIIPYIFTRAVEGMSKTNG